MAVTWGIFSAMQQPCKGSQNGGYGRALSSVVEASTGSERCGGSVSVGEAVA